MWKSAFIFFLSAWTSSGQLLVDTFAGGKIRSGIPAQAAFLSRIAGLASDSAGNTVFCEPGRHIIRRIGADGSLTTLAGTGVSGYSGDGGPALNATLNQPEFPRLDPAGNLYFADTGNNRIRRIDTHGVITTVAGDGIPLLRDMDLVGPATSLSLGNLLDLAVTNGSVYFSEQFPTSGVRRITPSGRLEMVNGVPFGYLAADDAGNLYVNDSAYNQGTHIVRLGPDGGITQIAGYGTNAADDGQPALDSVFQGLGFMAAAAGNLYFVQNSVIGNIHNPVPTRIRRIGADGLVQTLAGALGSQPSPDGPALQAPIAPNGFGVEPAGNPVFSEVTAPGGAVIRRVAGGNLTTIAGGNPQSAPDGTPARDAWFLNPNAITLDRNGVVYISEYGACLIRKVTSSGFLATVAGTGKCAVPTFSNPATGPDLPPSSAIAVNSKSQVYFADSPGNVYLIAADGSFKTIPGFVGLGLTGLVIDSKDRLYLASFTSLARLSGGTTQTIVAPPSQPGVPPAGSGPSLLLAIGNDPSGNVYFAGQYIGDTSQSIFRVNDDGSFAKVAGGVYNARSLAVDANGTAWTAGGNVSFANSSGFFSLGNPYGGFGGDGGPAQSARFNASGLAFGPDGSLYILDNERVRVMKRQGPQTTPLITNSGIVNALGYSGGSIAPGELITIFGANLGNPGVQVNPAENNRIGLVLDRTKVLFRNAAQPLDSVYGAIQAVTPNQINVFAPFLFTAGMTIQMIVQVDDAVSRPATVAVAEAAPELATSNQSGTGQGAILNQDGSVNSGNYPARPGSIVSLFGTGAGAVTTDYAYLDGSLVVSTPYPLIAQSVMVTIGGQSAEVTYAGSAPVLPVGLFQINVRVPPSVLGDVPIKVTIGGTSSTRAVTISAR